MKQVCDDIFKLFKIKCSISIRVCLLGNTQTRTESPYNKLKATIHTIIKLSLRFNPMGEGKGKRLVL